jgi:hypothetical protein
MDERDTEHEVQQTASLCRTSFTTIFAAIGTNKLIVERISQIFYQRPGEQPIFTLSDLRDEFEQFQIWAENIGVFASDHASLDYRLREAPDVKESVVSLMLSLRADLEEGKDPANIPEISANCPESHIFSSRTETMTSNLKAQILPSTTVKAPMTMTNR